MRLHPIPLMLAAAALCAAPPAHATTIVRFAFDAMCTQAEMIAHVRCTASTSLIEEGTGRIVTRTRLEVLHAVKGEPGDEIVLTLPGGKVDGRRLQIPGIPRFSVGAETVVFLTAPDDTGSPWPLGLDQGCYRTGTGHDGRRTVVLQSGVTPLPEGALFKPASHRPFRVDLEQFLQEIRRVLNQPSGAR